jgi:ATP-binding cassette subfamily B protein
MVIDPIPARQKEGFKLFTVFSTFTSLPRVVRLVWSTNAPLASCMGLLNLLRGFTPAVTVIITKLVIDSVVYGIRIHSVEPIWLPVTLQLVVGLLDSLFNILNNMMKQLLQELVGNRVQLMILEKANTLDLAFFENAEFYDKLRHASSEAHLKPVAMITQTFDLIRTTITLISMLVILLQLTWWLAIVALIMPFPSFIANAGYGWASYQRMMWQSPERRKMFYFSNLITVDQYNKEIKLFNLGSFFVSLYRRLAEKFYQESKGMLVGHSLRGYIWASLGVVANSAIYLYVALQAVLGRISLGGLTLYTQSVLQVGSSFQGVLDGVSITYSNNLFVNTLFSFLEYEPQIVSPVNPTPISVQEGIRGLDMEFRNVSFTYPGKKEAVLKNVSFTIQAGEAIALVGRNGAGKTTLVKLLGRLYDPDEGEILIGGHNIKEYALEELREQIGVIFQDFVNYQMSARENIGVGRIEEVENLELIAKAAHKSGADVVIEQLKNGYETMLGSWFDEGRQLSGGQWQKMALARAFMRDSRILILDEPTSSLDAQTEYEVFTHFRTLMEGKTAIFISHRFSTLRLADHIFVLENGHIIEDGSHKELMELDGHYAELFNLQAEAYR